MGEESKVRGNVCCRRASPGQTVCQAIDGPEIEGAGWGCGDDMGAGRRVTCLSCHLKKASDIT